MYEYAYQQEKKVVATTLTMRRAEKHSPKTSILSQRVFYLPLCNYTNYEPHIPAQQKTGWWIENHCYMKRGYNDSSTQPSITN